MTVPVHPLPLIKMRSLRSMNPPRPLQDKSHSMTTHPRIKLSVPGDPQGTSKWRVLHQDEHQWIITTHHHHHEERHGYLQAEKEILQHPLFKQAMYLQQGAAQHLAKTTAALLCATSPEVSSRILLMLSVMEGPVVLIMAPFRQ